MSHAVVAGEHRLFGKTYGPARLVVFSVFLIFLVVLVLLGRVLGAAMSPTSGPAAGSPLLAPPAARVMVAQVSAQWLALDSVLAPCDAAATRHKSTPSDLDRIARLCRQAGLALLKFTPPPAVRDLDRAGFEAALETCQSTYLARGNVYRRWALAEDPEMIEAARIDAARADIDVHGCRIGYVAAARAVGLSYEALPPPVAGY